MGCQPALVGAKHVYLPLHQCSLLPLTFRVWVCVQVWVYGFQHAWSRTVSLPLVVKLNDAIRAMCINISQIL